MTTQSGPSVLINGFRVFFVISNSFGLGLRLSVGKLLAQAIEPFPVAVLGGSCDTPRAWR